MNSPGVEPDADNEIYVKYNSNADLKDDFSQQESNDDIEGAAQEDFQREMAERLCAPSGNKSYGTLSVRTQIAYDVKLLRKVSPSVFWPPPAVDSAIVQLRRKVDVPSRHELASLKALLSPGFSQRRKRLLPLLRATLPDAEEAFKALEIPRDSRAEHLSIGQWHSLAQWKIHI